jgi:type III secretion protein T
MYCGGQKSTSAPRNLHNFVMPDKHWRRMTLTYQDYVDLIRQAGYSLQPALPALPRLLAAFTVVPLIGSLAVPTMARISFVLGLAVFLYPLHNAAMPTEPLNSLLWLCIVAKEIAIGIFLGFSCSLFFWVVEGVGSLLDTLVGNNNLFLFNPMLNQESGPFSILLGQIGAMLFIAFGGIIMLLQVVIGSFVAWPVFSFFPTWSHAARTFLIERSADVLSTAVQMGMPVLTVLMLIDFGLGLLNRSASQINAYTLSMPIKAIISVLFLALTVVFLGDPEGPLLRLMEMGRALMHVAL